MDCNSDTSMLSDDLKPRRTPVPAMFSDMMPRPSVPDLSIIETPQSTAPGLPSGSVQPQTVFNHLSYNDWRLKTGNATHSASVSTNDSPRSCGPPTQTSKMPSPSIMKSINSPRDTAGYSREKIGEHLVPKPLLPSNRTVAYTNFHQRPTSAPAVRTQQVESEALRDHTLSKSAPPTRATNPHAQPSNYINPTSAPNRFVHQSNAVNGFGHFVNSHAQQPPPNTTHGIQSLDREQNSRNQPPHAIRSFSSAHVDNMEAKRRSIGQMSELMIPCKDIVKSQNDPLGSNEVPYETHHTHQERNFSVHPVQYNPPRKSAGPCACHEQSCCLPPPPCHGSHSFHPVHTSPYPQVSYDELYKIVLAQNDQLKALQTQVERLLVSQDQQQNQAPLREREAEKLPLVKSNPNKMIVAEEGTQTSDCEYVEEDCQKMSIGVMTSFIQTVTYRGRVGRHNVSEHEGSHSKNSNSSKSPSSDDCSAASVSSTSKSSSDKDQKCCKECSSKERKTNMVKNRSSKIEKVRQCSRDVDEQPQKDHKNKRDCSEGCNCNNPGVSAAISAVRGCQAALAGMTPNEYSTFNGADLPPVTEQPVSPVSSIHVDLHDYRSSSSDDDSCSSQSDDEESSDGNDHRADKDHESANKPVGWTFYNNVLGQVNKILEERDVGSPTLTPSKQTDVSVSKRVAFETMGTKGEHNLKEMALKYLKENHPEELASSIAPKKLKKPRGENGKDRGDYNMPAPNMSFATFRYLERYNLLPENFNPQQYLEGAANMQGYPGNSHEPQHGSILNKGSKKSSRLLSGKVKSRSNFPMIEPSSDRNYQLHPVKSNPKGHINPSAVRHASPKKNLQATTATSKILDITTLRQQPKLL